MGHSEMRLAVAGLSEEEVGARAAALAEGAWDSFPARERVAYAFARKMTAAPWTVDDADLEALAAAWGEDRAVDIAWKVAWGAYMTRIADAFQLPLERTNVFRRAP